MRVNEEDETWRKEGNGGWRRRTIRNVINQKKKKTRLGERERSGGERRRKIRKVRNRNSSKRLNTHAPRDTHLPVEMKMVPLNQKHSVIIRAVTVLLSSKGRGPVKLRRRE